MCSIQFQSTLACLDFLSGIFCSKVKTIRHLLVADHSDYQLYQQIYVYTDSKFYLSTF